MNEHELPMYKLIFLGIIIFLYFYYMHEKNLKETTENIQQKCSALCEGLQFKEDIPSKDRRFF